MTAPYRTAAMIGCAIAIDREFFFEIGTFDMDMTIWGGENTELSLRVRYGFFLIHSNECVVIDFMFSI